MELFLDPHEELVACTCMRIGLNASINVIRKEEEKQRAQAIVL